MDRIWSFLALSIPQLGFLGIVLIILKKPLESVIGGSIERSLQFTLDKKLEALRAEFQRKDRQLASGLEARESELQAIRTSALSGLANRNSIMIQKRIEAAEAVWAAVYELRRFHPIVYMMAHLKFEETAEATKHDTALRERFAEAFSPYQMSSLDLKKAILLQPFVPIKVWTVFSAYQSIVGCSLLEMEAIRLGTGSDMFNKSELSNNLVRQLRDLCPPVLKEEPHSMAELLSVLEERLLLELREVLEGTTAEREIAESAGTIVRRSFEIQEGLSVLSQQNFLSSVPRRLVRASTSSIPP